MNDPEPGGEGAYVTLRDDAPDVGRLERQPHAFEDADEVLSPHEELLLLAPAPTPAPARRRRSSSSRGSGGGRGRVRNRRLPICAGPASASLPLPKSCSRTVAR